MLVRRFFVYTDTTFEIPAATFDFLSLFLDLMLVRFTSIFGFFFVIIHHLSLIIENIPISPIATTHNSVLILFLKKNSKSQKLWLDFQKLCIYKNAIITLFS